MRISDWSSDVCSSDLLVRSGNQIVGALPQYAAEAPLGGGKQHLPVGMPCIRGNGKAKAVPLTNGFAIDQHAAAFFDIDRQMPCALTNLPQQDCGTAIDEPLRQPLMQGVGELFLPVAGPCRQDR